MTDSMHRGPARRRNRRRVLAGVAIAGISGLGIGRARAQGHAATIHLVVGFNPGGAADRVARALAPELAQASGRSVVVDNVPGANSARAIARVGLAEPNGDVLLFASSAIAHPDNAAGIAALRPVIVTSTSPMVLVVRASLPVHDPQSFVSYLRSLREVNYGSAGVGNATHLCSAELMARLHIEATNVPYQGGTPGIPDLLAGRLDFMVMGSNGTIPQHTGLRMLAITTAQRSRLKGFDHLPTIAETLVPGFDQSLWQAVWAPARVSDSEVAALNARFRAILAEPQVRAQLAELGAEVVSGTTQAAADLFQTEVERYRARLSR